MTIRNISEAKAQLSALVESVQNGETVILAKAGKPVAKIVPYDGLSRPRTSGRLAGKIWIAPDFDTLPQEVLDSFYKGDLEPK